MPLDQQATRDSYRGKGGTVYLQQPGHVLKLFQGTCLRPVTTFRQKQPLNQQASQTGTSAMSVAMVTYVPLCPPLSLANGKRHRGLMNETKIKWGLLAI